MTLSVVIVGITHWHAPRYMEMLAARGASVVGACDIDAIAGAAVAGKAGIFFMSDADLLIQKTRPDFAIVLPRHDRATLEISTVAARGVAMLVEKPMGRNAVEARASADAIRRYGVFASTCFPNRYLSIWKVYKELAAQDALGTLMHAHFRTINGPPSRYIDYGVPWMLDPAISGGGAIRNLGIHGADAIASLAGGRELTLKGSHISSNGYHGAVEDFGTAIFSTSDGFTATLEAGYTYANLQEGGDYEWRIATTGVYLHECNGRLRVHKRGGVLEEHSVHTPHFAYERMANAALDAFESGRQPPVPVETCVRSVELQDMIYAATNVVNIS